MGSLDFASILLTIIAVRCDGFLYTMRYKQLQGDSEQSGITCAMARREAARGVEFDTASDTYTSLGTDWFSSPTTQPGHNYLELIELVHHFEKNKRVLTPVPANFRLGDSIVLYLEKEASAVGVVTIQFDLFDGNGVPGRFGPTDHVHFHVNNVLDPGKMNFRSFVNGGWTVYETINDPFHNGTGKIELVVMATEILVYVDDDNVYNYTTPLTVPDNLIPFYQGYDTECERLQYLYKN